MTFEAVGIPIQIRTVGEYAGQRVDEPVTVGIPFPRGLTPDIDQWTLAAGEDALDFQPRVLERWPDGSLRWALLDFHVSLPEGTRASELRLRPGRSTRPETQALLSIESTEAGRLHIATGACSFALDSAATGLIAGAIADGEPVLGSGGAALRVTGSTGAWGVEWHRMEMEAAGPVRATVIAHGRAIVGLHARLALTLRLDFFAGSPAVRVRLTARNPSRAVHPGGIWELGDPGSQLIKDLALVVPPAGTISSVLIRYSLEREAPFAECRSSLRVHQESSGGAHWQSTNHVNRHGIVPLRFRGYHAHADGQTITGLRASPIVTVGDERRRLGVAVPQFWENFPALVHADASALGVSFWPADAADLHELQGGEQKTFECFVSFGPAADDALRWCRSRLVAHATPGWYARAGAMPFFIPAADDDNALYKALVNSAIEGPDTFRHKRERVDEYGWRHFGDIYGDHEAIRHPGPSVLVSHYNNQYDPIGGFLCQFMRTGDHRWWEQADDLARHVVDVDIYHTTEDKAGYNNGLFWHSYHYVDAGRSTHRSYPQGTHGGGPSPEHNYPSGLLLHHLMTGDAASREAAVGLAQFVIDADDGTKTVFRWLDRGDTGLASASRTPYYHGPGRGSGNSLNALLDGHRLTGERRFLEKAEQVIRRCTHPRQDIGALTLLDIENRWFYTIFLQSLGKYLEYKVHLGELDAMYAYGRAVLLHFARWMAANERPYLDRPEQLEYPTETWAAQDLRKSEVFDYASRHASGEDKQAFLERAAFFHRYSLSTLAQMPTRTLTRPVVLLLANGRMRDYVSAHDEELPAPLGDWSAQWPSPERFVPQRVRAVRRAVALAAAGLLTATVLLASLL